MPPDPDAVRGGSAHTAKSKPAKAVASFAAGVVEKFTAAVDDPVKASTLVTELQEHVCMVKKHPRIHALHGNVDLDRQGTKLFNLCITLRKANDQEGSEASPERKLLLLLARLFALQIMDLSGFAAENDFAQTVRLFNLALRVGTCCIADSNFELAMIAMQKAADYNGHLQKLSQSQQLTQGEANECKQLEAEWLVLRLTIAWKEDKIGVAEHMFSNAEALTSSLHCSTAEKLAELIFKIANDFICKKDYPMAVKWSQRAFNMLNGQDIENISRDAVELRLTIAQGLVTSCLGLRTTEGYERAQNLVCYLESEIGDKMAVLMLNLEVLIKSPGEVFDGDAYAKILERMIQIFNQEEARFKLLVYHIRKLHEKSPTLGIKVLSEFLLELNTQQCNDSWIETLVVSRVWMATSHEDSDSSIDETQTLLQCLKKPLSAEGTIAAQTLIWKKLEYSFTQRQFEMTEKWCRLALSPLFCNCGPQNRSKLERKLLLCATERNDFDYASEVFFGMSEDTQNQPMTRYLMYKIAIRTRDRKLAFNCLELITKGSQNNDFLYACVLDSHHSRDDVIVIEAMKKLAEKYEYSEANPVHLPALMRCMIRLLYKPLDSGGDDIDQEQIAQEICTTFKNVSIAIQRDPKDVLGKKLFDINELEWFCQNSYNLGLKHVDTWDLRHIVTILTCSLNIASHFPEDMPSQMAVDLSLKSIFCNFVIASALVVLARAQDNLEQQLQDYLDMRQHISAFDTALQEQLQVLDEVSRNDLAYKLSILLVFDFEGAICLKDWDGLGQIVRKASACQSLETFQAMGDCLLRERPPVEELFTTMRKIVNEVAALPGFDSVKLARYTRCLFQAVLPFSDQLAQQLMDDVCKMVKDAAKSKVQWPDEELEWITTAAHNHCIDLYIANQINESRTWMEKVMELAQYYSTDSDLVGTFQRQYLKLRFDN